MKNHDFTWSDYHTFSRISGIRTGTSGEILKLSGGVRYGAAHIDHSHLFDNVFHLYRGSN